MREFQKKKTVQAILCSRYMLLLYAIIIIFLANAVYGAYGKYRQGKSLEATATRELETLEARKDYMSSHIKAIGAVGGQEKEILDRFGMVKPGEHLIILVGKEVVSNKSELEGKNLISRIWGFFSGN